MTVVVHFQNGFPVQTVFYYAGLNVALVALLNRSHTPGLSLNLRTVMFMKPEFLCGICRS